MLASRPPEGIKRRLRPLKQGLKNLLYYGTGRFCPICRRSSRRFRAFGVIPREDAECVHCGSLERHRLEWLFIERATNLFDGSSKKVLHVAPERCFERMFKRRLGDGYLTADLSTSRATVAMDIMDIGYPDQTFDVILCSHVLEHVPDDRRAMRELFRVLKDDGWAILLVPIVGDETREDPSIIDPAERARLFGQADHVRSYGADYVDRLREAGFIVAMATVSDMVGPVDALRMGLTRASGEIYHCTKRASSG